MSMEKNQQETYEETPPPRQNYSLLNWKFSPCPRSHSENITSNGIQVNTLPTFQNSSTIASKFQENKASTRNQNVRVIRGYRGLGPLSSELFNSYKNLHFVSPPSLPLAPPPILTGTTTQPRIVIPNRLPPVLQNNPAVLIPPELSGLKPTSYPPRVIFTSLGLKAQLHPNRCVPNPLTFKTRRIRSAIKEATKDLKARGDQSRTATLTDPIVSNNYNLETAAPQFRNGQPSYSLTSFEENEWKRKETFEPLTFSCPVLKLPGTEEILRSTRSRESRRWDAEVEDLEKLRSSVSNNTIDEGTEHGLNHTDYREVRIYTNLDDGQKSHEELDEPLRGVQKEIKEEHIPLGIHVRPRRSLKTDFFNFRSRFLPIPKNSSYLNYQDYIYQRQMLAIRPQNYKVGQAVNLKNDVFSDALRSLKEEKLRLCRTREAILQRMRSIQCSLPGQIKQTRQTGKSNTKNIGGSLKCQIGTAKLKKMAIEAVHAEHISKKEKGMAAASKQRLLRFSQMTNLNHQLFALTPHYSRRQNLKQQGQTCKKLAPCRPVPGRYIFNRSSFLQPFNNGKPSTTSTSASSSRHQLMTLEYSSGKSSIMTLSNQNTKSRSYQAPKHCLKRRNPPKKVFSTSERQIGNTLDRVVVNDGKSRIRSGTALREVRRACAFLYK